MDRSSFSFLSVLHLSAAFVVLTTGVVALTAGTALQNLNKGSAIEINSQDFTWWKNARFRFEKSEIASPILFQAQPPSPLNNKTVQLVAPLIEKKMHRTSSKRAICRVKAVNLFVGPVAPPCVLPILNERMTMQSIHGLLTARFRVAMNTQSPVVNQVIVAAPVPTQTNTSALFRARVKHGPHKVRPVIAVAARPAVRQSHVAARPLGTQSDALAAAQSQIQDLSIRITQSEPQTRLDIRTTATKEQGLVEPIARKNTDSDNTIAMTTAPRLTGESQVGLVGAENIDTQISEQIQKFNAITSSALTTQTTASSEYPVTVTHREYSTVPATPTGNAIEAFRKDPIYLVATKTLISAEGQESGVQGKWWEFTKSETHWPTLVWMRNDDAGVAQPLISNNSALTLATAAHAELQSDTGIVFGKIPAGWDIDLSGRSERPLFFDEDYKSVSIGTTDRIRNFALVNVAPGMPLLYFTAVGGAKTAALAVPVKPGEATYVDVPAPSLRTMSGRIFDASSSTPRGLRGISVSVVGQDGLTAISNEKGFFTIKDVLVFGEQSLYLDVKPDDKSFIHRYRVSAQTIKNLSLFYFSESIIDFWLRQPEGGVSPAGGLVIGAFPETVAQAANQLLYPNITPLLKNPTLTSEAYTLSDANRLQPKTGLTQSSPRILDLQVPEGANIASLNYETGSETKKSAWSELVISQQGVICVVGPY